MLKIDNTLLQEVGLGELPAAEKNSFLKHIYETLEMRVGIRLADQMSNQQLDEFERYFEAKDDAGAFKWLETNFPNYKDIVQQEYDKLKAEVAQSAPQILAASQNQGQGQTGPVSAPIPQPAQVSPAQSPSPQPQSTPHPAAPQYQPPQAPADPMPPQSPQAPHFAQQSAVGPAAPQPGLYQPLQQSPQSAPVGQPLSPASQDSAQPASPQSPAPAPQQQSPFPPQQPPAGPQN